MDYFSIDQFNARIFNTYGPRMHPNDGRVVSNFIIHALEGNAITVFGIGEQTRSFCYIDDLVEGLVCLMEQDDFSRPVNLGNPAEINVIALAHKISALMGDTIELKHLPLPQDDPVRRCPDISLAKEKLGWAPNVDLETGLRNTIAYFKERIHFNQGVLI